MSNEVFEPLNDESVFQNFQIVRGTLTWMINGSVVHVEFATVLDKNSKEFLNFAFTLYVITAHAFNMPLAFQMPILWNAADGVTTLC